MPDAGRGAKAQHCAGIAAPQSVDNRSRLRLAIDGDTRDIGGALARDRDVLDERTVLVALLDPLRIRCHQLVDEFAHTACPLGEVDAGVRHQPTPMAGIPALWPLAALPAADP